MADLTDAELRELGRLLANPADGGVPLRVRFAKSAKAQRCAYDAEGAHEVQAGALKVWVETESYVGGEAEPFCSRRHALLKLRGEAGR